MLRKTVAVTVLGLCILFVAGQFVLADAGAGATPAGHKGQLAEKYKSLPKWKQQAIKMVLKRAHERVLAVRADYTLTPEQKTQKIHQIRERARAIIKKIIQAAAPLHRAAAKNPAGGGK